MKKLAIFVAAFVLTLGLAQCKKEQPTAQNLEGETVYLTVKVGNGSRADVNTSTGHITFNDNDKLYVGYNDAYVGTLSYASGSFSGSINITEAETPKPLHFYYLGGGTANQVDGTQRYTVDISDQRTNYPVISYGPSTKDFSTNRNSYTTVLLNKCALVKFTSTNEIPVGTAVVVSGLNNQVEVNFNGNTLSYSQTNNGSITLHTENATSRWAILLPQTNISNVKANAEGYNEASVNFVTGISENDYLTNGASFTLTAAAPSHEYVDLGLSVLWAICNVGADNPEDPGYYFAWGETTTKDTYDWSAYQYANGTSSQNPQLTKYCSNSSYGYNGFTDNLTTLEPGDDAATANWGSGWRMPTQAEFQELIDNTTVTRTTTQNGVKGFLFTAKNDSGNSIFLPAAGLHNDFGFNNEGGVGYYWSSSLVTGNQIYASPLHFSYSDNACFMYFGYRYCGFSVRGVRSVSKN